MENPEAGKRTIQYRRAKNQKIAELVLPRENHAANTKEKSGEALWFEVHDDQHVEKETYIWIVRSIFAPMLSYIWIVRSIFAHMLSYIWTVRSIIPLRVAPLPSTLP